MLLERKHNRAQRSQCCGCNSTPESSYTLLCVGITYYSVSMQVPVKMFDDLLFPELKTGDNSDGHTDKKTPGSPLHTGIRYTNHYPAY